MRPALAFAIALTAAPAFAQEPPPPPPGPRPAIFVLSGEGRASATPDLGIINSGVVSEGATAREALDANTAAMAKLIATIKAAGVEDKDVATSGFSVQPRYIYSQRKDGTQEPPRITGYEVRNTVTVKVRDLTKFGGILDKAVTEGSNQIDSLSFDIADKTKLYEEARKSALADARAKAELYAAAAGVKLGRLRELSEQTGSSYPPPRPMMRMEASAKADVPIERGEQEISVNVTATWEIAP
ncbi:outer membrane protein [Terrihabitans soli]|uniref:Outer membrane protein n=1 Tax=Terrihabitans soli TaxID=708113 RepID=A0A6S6QY89_9HYPH|nr:SIMPL domain-containing protein [Terrihabitans soli]BCJ91538.1 outer membrane protein [Terrihabitans soli]